MTQLGTAGFRIRPVQVGQGVSAAPVGADEEPFLLPPDERAPQVDPQVAEADVTLHLGRSAQEDAGETSFGVGQVGVGDALHPGRGQLPSEAGHGDKLLRFPAPAQQFPVPPVGSGGEVQHIGEHALLGEQQPGAEEAVAERRAPGPERRQRRDGGGGENGGKRQETTGLGQATEDRVLLSQHALKVQVAHRVEEDDYDAAHAGGHVGP